MEEIIKLKMKGPFNLIGRENIFNIEDGYSSGIYFLTVKVGKRSLIEYVGITTRSFKDRFTEHIRELLSGGYQLYDFEKLKEHKQFVVWPGRFSEDKRDITEFLNNYHQFTRIIEQQLREFKIFLIPANEEKRTLERIEGKIYQILIKNNDERIATFIKGVRFSPKHENEEPMKVEIKSNILSPDIPNDFEF
jgi:hypothetical protein